MEQVALVPSGVHHHTQHCLYADASRIIYSSTLGVYVHAANKEGYPLSNVYSGPFVAATSMGCDGAIVAMPTEDGQIFFYELDTGIQTVHQCTTFVPLCVAASPDAVGTFFFGGAESQYLVMKDGVIKHPEGEKFSSSGDLVVANYSTRNPDLVGIGTSTGFLLLYSVRQGSLRSRVDAFEALREGGLLSRVFGESPRITDIAFDPLSDNYVIIAATTGDMVMIDMSDSCSIVHTFERANTGLKKIAWLPNQPGSFLTIDGTTSALRYWNVSSKVPLSTHRPGPKPLTTVVAVPPNYETCAVGFEDGALGIYNMPLRKLEFATLPGHSETVFDCRFSRHDKDLVASCSFDKTIRLWSIRSMTLQTTIPAHNVVYCVAWSPDGHQIAAATADGSVSCYAVSSQRSLWKRKFSKDLAWRVVWCEREPGIIAAGSKDGVAVVVSATDGSVYRTYHHPMGCFGLDFDPFCEKHLMTGGLDGLIRIFNIENKTTHPAKELRGHRLGVYNVLYNPLVPNVFISGSDDNTVRLWNMNEEENSGRFSRVLAGHSNKVRALMWCSVTPYMCLSGSWDGTIRMWDTRTCVCIASTHNHDADVYSLSSHPERPLVFVSGSRDTTVRFWHMKALGHMHMDAAIGILQTHEVKDPVTDVLNFPRDAENHHMATGTAVTSLVRKLAESPEPVDRLRNITEFFEFPHGSADVVSCVRYLVDPKHGADSKCAVSPLDVLADVEKERAQGLEGLVRSRYTAATGSSQRNARLISAAEAYLRLGDVEKYCNLLVEAGEWERGIAAAPLISVDFWRDMCLKAADKLAADGDERAVEYYICASEGHKAADFLSSRGEYTNAMIVVQMCAQRTSDSVDHRGLRQQQESVALPPQVDALIASAKLANFASARAEEYLGKGNPSLAAAAFASSGARNECLGMLILGGRAALAHLTFHALSLSQSLIDVGFRNSAVYCASLGQWRAASLCAARVSSPSSVLPCALVISHCSAARALDTEPGTGVSGPGTTTEQLLKEMRLYDEVSANDRPPQSSPRFDTAAKQVAFYALKGPSGSSPSLCVVAANSLLEALVARVDHDRLTKTASPDSSSSDISLDALFEARDVAGLVVPPVVSSPVDLPAEYRQLMSLAYRVGVEIARRQRFTHLLPEMIRAAIVVTIEDDVIAVLREELSMCSKGGSMTVFQRPDDVEETFCPLGDHLPSHGPDGTRVASHITSLEVIGPLVVLENGVDVISLREAMEWNHCCWFSPLGTGERLFPFAM